MVKENEKKEERYKKYAYSNGKMICHFLLSITAIKQRKKGGATISFPTSGWDLI